RKPPNKCQLEKSQLAGELARRTQQAIQGGFAMSKERRLGRGLEALLGRAWYDSDSAIPPAATVDVSGDIRISRDENGQSWLNCDAIIRNPYQPRQTFEEAEIADLADSIRTHGILQP